MKVVGDKAVAAPLRGQVSYFCLLDIHKTDLGEKGEGNDNSHAPPVSGCLEEALVANVSSDGPVKVEGLSYFRKLEFYEGVLSARMYSSMAKW